MRPSTMPWPSAVSSDPTQNPKIQRGLISVRARIRNSNDTLRNTMPSAITVNGPNSLPSTPPPGERERRDEQPQPQQRPELVGIAPRAEQAHHAAALFRGRQLQQQSDADVESVEHDAGRHQQQQQPDENQRHPERGIVGAQAQRGGQGRDHEDPPVLRTGTTP
ncbi:Uncharacterised protein [Bordetella pertussis]|nr:Uncharacterised protein [Bordetella pertussis]